MDPARTARLMRERSALRRAQREQHAEQVRATVAAAVRPLLPAQARAWLIGSLASGTFGVGSDVDLVLDGVAPDRATEIEVAAARASGAPVDVLRLDDLPESFRRRVQAEGIALHAA